MSRQAYYQNISHKSKKYLEEVLILKEILSIRRKHPRLGVRKLYFMLQLFMLEHNIKMGRDDLFTLLSSYDLLVKKRKNKVRTTHSFHWPRKHPNLIIEFVPTGINQLWVSGITY